MKLRAIGWVDEKVLKTRPVLTLYIDGRVLGSPRDPIENGFYYFESEVPADMLAGKEWVDLNMVLSSVAWHWHDPPNLAVAVLFRFDWRRFPESLVERFFGESLANRVPCPSLRGTSHHLQEGRFRGFQGQRASSRTCRPAIAR